MVLDSGLRTTNLIYLSKPDTDVKNSNYAKKLIIKQDLYRLGWIFNYVIIVVRATDVT